MDKNCHEIPHRWMESEFDVERSMSVSRCGVVIVKTGSISNYRYARRGFLPSYVDAVAVVSIPSEHNAFL